MSAPQNVVAVIFDFDDTLTDDSTTQLLASRGIDPARFWGVTMKERVDSGWDPALAYLNYIVENVGTDRQFGSLTNQDLKDFGKGLKFYNGLPGLFRDLREIASEHRISNPVVEFYVISGGLEDVIRGSSIAKHLDGIWGCQFHEEGGQIRAVKNVISFTEKTRFIFEINKGLRSRNKPYAVNEGMDESSRRVPFRHMIYVGDGLTDVPCFSLIQRFGGKAFGVFDPKKVGSPRKAFEKLLTPHRVSSLNAPKYRKTDDLGALLRMAVSSICSEIDMATRTALPTS